MGIPEYYRCPNGHMMYEEEKYCVVCGADKFSYLGTKECPEPKKYCGIKFTDGEKFCHRHGRELRPIKN